MNKLFEYVTKACKAMSAKREIEIAESEVKKAQAKLEEKKAKLGMTSIKDVEKTAKACKYTVTSNEMLVEVNRKSIVKDIRRHLESIILKRHMLTSNDDDFQLLYNHLHRFFSLKHDVDMPYVIRKSGIKEHIDSYAAHRTNSVMNDITCKGKVLNCKCDNCK